MMTSKPKLKNQVIQEREEELQLQEKDKQIKEGKRGE